MRAASEQRKRDSKKKKTILIETFRENDCISIKEEKLQEKTEKIEEKYTK